MWNTVQSANCRLWTVEGRNYYKKHNLLRSYINYSYCDELSYTILKGFTKCDLRNAITIYVNKS
ncbi:hypothetical protein KsCSTR_36650 [Candidatus Kuenenia stuttgartiensis]|uniref:Uncharacterized protein n=1 Tax=Kuenenia stuttgartiensis TaxID=174633 RepID=Q1Q6F9_KUEST|nr:hypothetical protein KsCSTR_36650 [Candidatus Kuenenia stuttgartiensis]CAJ73153.1 unknown protein [Candidatus Kuenenia stuttgartiensis]